MPINYKEYHPKWSLISRLIRFKRANNKCEECGAINYAHVNKKTREPCLKDEADSTWIVLTVAHLDHNKGNNRFNNLKALCQKCHLAYDLGRHIMNRKYGRRKNNYKLALITKNKDDNR